MSDKGLFRLCGVLLLITVVVLLLNGPVLQDQAYHNFADQRVWLGLPHGWNVLSNLPFLLTGGYGLLRLQTLQITGSLRWMYGVFFFSVALVALGSGYYHLAPSDGTLVWDRLPMTLAFMTLCAIILAEYFSPQLASRYWLWLVLLGAVSVAYWYVCDDLRIYILVQFFPMLVIPLILLSRRNRYSHVVAYWYLLLAYLLAKLLEHFDAPVFDLLGTVSGHSLKHVAAALGILVLLRAYQRRRPIAE